jgi:hypothetical protein
MIWRDQPARVHTGRVTGTRVLILPRSGPAIWEALARVSPSDGERFAEELRAAITDAGTTLDLDPVDKVLHRWWQIAVIRSEALTDDEQRLLERVREDGDFSGFLEQQPDGSFRRLG